jgi:hypothetical protein
MFISKFVNIYFWNVNRRLVIGVKWEGINHLLKKL